MHAGPEPPDLARNEKTEVHFSDLRLLMVWHSEEYIATSFWSPICSII